MAHIEAIKNYLQKCCQELQLKHRAAGELSLRLDHIKNANERDLNIVLENFGRFA